MGLALLNKESRGQLESREPGDRKPQVASRMIVVANFIFSSVRSSRKRRAYGTRQPGPSPKALSMLHACGLVAGQPPSPSQPASSRPELAPAQQLAAALGVAPPPASRRSKAGFRFLLACAGMHMGF